MGRYEELTLEHAEKSYGSSLTEVRGELCQLGPLSPHAGSWRGCDLITWSPAAEPARVSGAPSMGPRCLTVGLYWRERKGSGMPAP